MDDGLTAITWLVALLKTVIPLAAAAQRERLILGARAMDLLGDAAYCNGGKELPFANAIYFGAYPTGG